ncbi:MAG: bifunctional oligoribonuclease/PAP phosphatase NrnA [Thermomicrobiales bacterium]|nr:bifunctional oligoribonuclease/PAP phosphatase NrnA [Thermomicrobiales bacterium]
MSVGDWSLDRSLAMETLAALKSATRILMPTHQNVDADGLATPLALVHALEPLGVELIPMLSDGQRPKNLDFLPGIERVIAYGVDPLPEYDMLCLVDCSDRRRLGAFYQDDPSRVDGTVPIVNIDHHVTNDHFGIVNVVFPSAASTAEIMTDLIRCWECPITTDIAHCLLAGIYGDTLGLRTEATTARTMRTSADLVDAGGNPAAITDSLFRLKPRSTVCLWEHLLRRVEWTGSLIWTEVTTADLAVCRAEPSEAEGLVNFLAGTEGSRAAAILYETEGGWRVSMRSLPTDVDVAAIASVFGGGGHPRAAGVTVLGGEAEKHSFLAQVAELIVQRPDGD